MCSVETLCGLSYLSLLNDSLTARLFPPGGLTVHTIGTCIPKRQGSELSRVKKFAGPLDVRWQYHKPHGRRATARPATSKLALQTENGSDNGRPSLRAWAGSARLGRQWLQQPRQAVRRERLRKCAGAAHEENKWENQQQAVHRLVQVALGEQCEDGRSVREVDEGGRSVRDVKQIRLRRGAPAWESLRPRKSAERQGRTRNAEGECQSDSENSH